MAPLKRLLRLRERAEQGEKMALRVVESALQAEQQAFESFAGAKAGAVHEAGAIAWAQGARDNSWQRAQQLERQVQAHMQQWQAAKREHRQAELLLAERKREHEQEQLRKELRQQEDWARARYVGAHEEDA